MNIKHDLRSAKPVETHHNTVWIKLIFTLFVCISTTVGRLYATDPYSFTRYTRATGLPTTTIEDMLQDSDGYIYLAAWSGLYRFNGKQFINYKAITAARQGEEHPTNRFIKIETDAIGWLWILSGDGAVYHFDTASGKMERAFPNLNITAFYKLAHDDFCFVDDRGVIYRSRYPQNKKTGEVETEKYFSLPEGVILNKIVKDSSDNIYILTDSSLYCNRVKASDIPAYSHIEYEYTQYFGSSEGRIVEFLNGNKSVIQTGIDSDIDLIANLSEGTSFLVGSSEKGLFEFNRYDNSSSAVKNSIAYHGTKLEYIHDINDNIWIWSAQGGLYRYDADNHELIPFYNRKQQSEWGADNYVNAVLSDKQGNIWISASWGGLERVIFHEGTFKFFSVDGTRDIRVENSIRALFKNNEGIVFAATKDGKVHLYTSEFKPIATWDTIDPVYSIAQSQDGYMWFGTKGGGIIENKSLYGYNPHRYSNDDNYFGANAENIYCINTEDKNRIWIGSFDGSISYIDMTDKERRFVSKRNLLSFPTTQENKIRYIKFAPNGKMFVCGTLGLFVCENPSAKPEEIQFKHFPNTTDIDIQYLLFTRGGELWASSFGNGLLHFNGTEPGSEFKAFTTGDGLLSNFIFSAIEDKFGIIWIATYGGLNQYNPDTGSMIGYSFEDIGIKLGFNEGSPMEGSDGNIYFATTSGLLHFDPAEISNGDFVPKLLISYCSVSGKQIDIDSSVPIKIKHKDYIRIALCAIDMTAPHRVRYAYKLENQRKSKASETEWVNVNNEGQIYLKDLRPGKYLLHMRSTNGNGLTVNNETSLPISVRPDVSLWVILLVLLFCSLSAASVGLTLKLRSKKEGEKDTTENGILSEEELFKKSITAYLEKELDNGELSVTDMAAAMNMSRSTLFEKSNAHLGMAPMEYLRKLRFERAAELIRKADLPISQIAYMTGFNDSHYFSKAFKKEFGLTPSDYRQSSREN